MPAVDNASVGLTVGTPANGVALSTGSFTPPNNSLLAVPVLATSASGAPDITIAVSGGGLSWTKISEQEGASGGHVSWWGALVATGAAMTIDITRTAGNGGVNGIVAKPLIITGHDTGTPWAAKAKGENAANAPTLALGNSAANGSRFLYAALTEPDNGGAPTSTDTIDAATYAGAADVAFCFKSADTAVSGTAVSGNIDWAGAGAVNGVWAAVEIYAAGSVPGGSVDVAGAASGVASAAGDVYTPQIAAPIADISAGAWVASGGGSLYAALDEAAPADADTISVPAAGSVCELRLAAMGDPASSAGHVLRYRLASPAGNPVRFTLRQGAGTTIAQWTETPGTTPADYAHALSGAEADSITDYTDLRVRIEAL